MSRVGLKSCDGKVFTLPSDTASLSLLVKDVTKHCTEEAELVIPLPNVPTAGLSLVVEWMQRKSRVPTQTSSSSCQCRMTEKNRLHTEEDSNLANWERIFFNNLDKDDLFLLLNTANYMGITSLIGSGASYVAEIISGMTLERTRDYLNISGDRTVNNEEVRLKWPWLNS